jgi:hypothetical protein
MSPRLAPLPYNIQSKGWHCRLAFQIEETMTKSGLLFLAGVLGFVQHGRDDKGEQEQKVLSGKGCRSTK